MIKGALHFHRRPCLFFHIAANYPNIEEFYISDVNEELVLLYRTIQNEAEDLIELLSKIQHDYFKLESAHQRGFFNEIRNKLNANKSTFNYDKFSTSWIERSANFGAHCFSH